MRKSLLLISATLLASASMSARSLTPQEALSRVNGTKALSRSGETPVLVYSAQAVNAASPGLYVFNRGLEDGYMVLSADDAVTPVLGYADNGTFDPFNIPDNMRWWLESYAAQVAYMAEHANASEDGIGAVYRLDPAITTAGEQRTAILPLCTTKWNQDAPYNNLCPTIGNQRCYTGCVATAIAQAMKYFNYPTKGKGTVSVSVNGSNQSMNLSTVTFNWSDMLDTYTAGGYNTTQGTAVATLMKAVGFAVKMSYGTSSSGAFSNDIPTALINNFSYDAATAYYSRDYYSISQWEQMIYDNLKNCGPVVYGGASYEGGHSFICDGYLDGYFHINWGWGGMSDGYFLLTALDPASQGIGGTTSAYIFQQDAILGMREPVSGSTSVTGMAVSGTLTGSVSGSSLTLSTILNPFAANFNGTIGIRLVNQATQATTYVRSQNISNLPCFYGYTSWPTTLPSTLAAGTYRVHPIYSTKTNPSTADWKDMLIEEGQPRYVTITKTGNSYSVTNEDVKRFTASNVQLNTEIYSGMPFSVTLTVSNPNPYPRTALIAPFFNRLSKVLAYGAETPVSLEANETKTITLTYTLSPSTASAGNYNMFIGEVVPADDDSETKSVTAISSAQAVTIKKASGTASLSVTDLTIENPNAVNAASMRGSYTLKCEGTYSAGALTLIMYNPTTKVNDGEITLPPYYIEAGETKTFNFDVIFDGAVAGKSYLAYLFDSKANQLNNGVRITVEGFVGIDDIITDEEPAATEYYTLQGIKVSADNLTPGIYVVRTISKDGKVATKKVVIK